MSDRRPLQAVKNAGDRHLELTGVNETERLLLLVFDCILLTNPTLYNARLLHYRVVSSCIRRR